jgi:hypothetical protein
MYVLDEPVPSIFISHLKMEATGFSETVVTMYKASGCNSEDHNLNYYILWKEQNIDSWRIN